MVPWQVDCLPSTRVTELRRYYAPIRHLQKHNPSLAGRLFKLASKVAVKSCKLASPKRCDIHSRRIGGNDPGTSEGLHCRTERYGAGSALPETLALASTLRIVSW